MTARILPLVIVLLATLAQAYPAVAQSDVTKTVWYSRFKQVALSFNPQGFDAWEQHISRNRINIVDTIPRDRSQQLLRTFNAIQAYVPVLGYGCKASWALVAADGLSLYMQYQRAHSDKARARSNPRTNPGLIASAQQLFDCAPQFQAPEGLYMPLDSDGRPLQMPMRLPCNGNYLSAAFEYLTGRNYAKDIPGAGPSRGLNPLSRYGPALSRGNFRGSSDVYQSRGYCAAEHRLSQRFFLDGHDGGSGYRDVGDLSVAIDYMVSEHNIQLLLNYRHPDRTRGRTGPLISSVYAGSRYFQLYSGGIFQNAQGAEVCPTVSRVQGQPWLQADQPVLVMGYQNAANASGTSFWRLRVPYGSSWGENGYMKLVKNASNMPGSPPGQTTVAFCGLGEVVGAFIPPNYQPSATNALVESSYC